MIQQDVEQTTVSSVEINESRNLMNATIELQPYNKHNQLLESNVHPLDWNNPTPEGRYHLVVIGAGTAGLVAAAGAAGLGAKVAIIERNLMGGDCLNVGCVPSKGVISAARIAASVRRANEFGVHADISNVDFAAAMDRMRRLRTEISDNDSVQRFSNLGVDVFLGQGKFVDSETIEVEGQPLKFKRSVIATGARAAAPPINGLDQVSYLTNESVFSLTELPRRIGIVGAGPIGCELAQSFSRFGSEVFLIESAEHILPREDRDAALIVQEALIRDGVNVLRCGRDLQLSPEGECTRIQVETETCTYDEVVDQLLVAVGRAPNVEGMNLEVAGIEFNQQGVTVNDRLQTSNKRVYAAGDIASKYKFTHAADFAARIVIQNALFKGRKRASDLIIPWATYTSPEIAHVGISERDAKQQGVEIDTYRQDFAEVDRAILEGTVDGFVKVHTRKGTDKILGATIVAENAGDMISEITLAMNNRVGLGKIGSTIHPYPTQAEAIRKLGDQYSRTRLTPLAKSLLGMMLKLP